MCVCVFVCAECLCLHMLVVYSHLQFAHMETDCTCLRTGLEEGPSWQAHSSLCVHVYDTHTRTHTECIQMHTQTYRECMQIHMHT